MTAVIIGTRRPVLRGGRREARSWDDEFRAHADGQREAVPPKGKTTTKSAEQTTDPQETKEATREPGAETEELPSKLRTRRR